MEEVMNIDLTKYYALRALEYEKVYQKPERQNDIPKIIAYLERGLKGLNILEIACGTGYWTQFISQTAKSILATDINKEVVEIAKAKEYPYNNVKFTIADIYKIANIDGKFNAGCGCFIWSHIPVEKLSNFLISFHKKIAGNGKIVFIDNKYVPGSSTLIAGKDKKGNTYQARKLENGTKHLVLKNFPDNKFITNTLSKIGANIRFQELEYYWLLDYDIM